jgi:hypothetical protein
LPPLLGIDADGRLYDVPCNPAGVGIEAAARGVVISCSAPKHLSHFLQGSVDLSAASCLQQTADDQGARCPDSVLDPRFVNT